MYASVGALLADSARCYPDKIAFIFEERCYSYGELDRLSSLLADRLEGLGLARGDRISLHGSNSSEWVIACYAVMKMGGVANPLNLMLTPMEAAYAMNDCCARAVLGAADKILALAPVVGSTRLAHRIAWLPSPARLSPSAPTLAGRGCRSAVRAPFMRELLRYDSPVQQVARERWQLAVVRLWPACVRRRGADADGNGDGLAAVAVPPASTSPGRPDT